MSLLLSLWLSCSVAVPMERAAKPRECVKVPKMEEVSHEMLVLTLPHVSSPVSGFPLASQCLWGKLRNLSFPEV